MLVSFAALAVAACADDPADPQSAPPPPREDVVTACGAYQSEACNAFGRCLGWSQTKLNDCIRDESAKCENELEPSSCWASQLDAYERCAGQVAGETCDETCGDNGFCFASCIAFCPAGA